ncbi:unnamed protein product [Arabis nemorensis]|uniref:Regulator of chromosome condensation 1/beta-lactamase-inhibitor protein II n=1 Tax=Arabis nemorensis TaxID=586526 RepID=A0A565CD24_9BRAS|nr:unnamed protein product [Arabis nemorensis]
MAQFSLLPSVLTSVLVMESNKSSTTCIHILHVSVGDEHDVALDSDGLVYTWGKCYYGALGHGD